MKGLPRPIESIIRNVIISLQTIAEWLSARLYCIHRRKGTDIENTPSLQRLEMDGPGRTRAQPLHRIKEART